VLNAFGSHAHRRFCSQMLIDADAKPRDQLTRCSLGTLRSESSSRQVLRVLLLLLLGASL
jgi:hypothetical protein